MNPAISLVSDPSSEAPRLETAPWSASCFFKVPNLSDETKRQISKASAWPAWTGLFDAMNNQIIRGRTAEVRQDAERGIVGVGIHAIARAVGIDVKTARRQIGRLEGLGLVAVHKPAKMAVCDPDTGRITSKSAGRTPPCIVYVTVTESHLRPFKRGLRGNLPLNGESKGAICPPSTGRFKGQSAPPSKDCSKEHSRHRPTARTCGIGRRQAGADTRRTNAWQEATNGPQAFTGKDADAFQAVKERLAREAAERAAEDERRRQERVASEASTPTPAQAADELRIALAALPAAKRKRAKAEGKRIKAEAAKVEPQPQKASDPEAEALAALIDQRRRELAAGSKETFREAFREERHLDAVIAAGRRELVGAAG